MWDRIGVDLYGIPNLNIVSGHSGLLVLLLKQKMGLVNGSNGISGLRTQGEKL